MNNLKVLENTRFISKEEAECLVLDLVEENCVDNIQKSRKRQIIGWFLRNYHYLPFSLISELLEYKSVSSNTEAIFSIIEAHPKPLSLSQEHHDDVMYFKEISSKFYGCSDNKFMDRVYDEDLTEALLLGAAKACGYMDRVSKIGWFAYTPVNSPLLNLFNISKMIEHGADSKVILEKYIIDEIRGLY
jgi:hypothetical protein